MKRRRGERIRNALAVVGVFVVVIGVWQLLVSTGTVSKYILPHPWATAKALWTGVVSGGSYRRDLLTTTEEMLLGFGIGAVIGLTLGGLLASFRLAERALLPYLVFLQTVPLVAVAPLLLVWFGFGITSKVVTVSLVVLFPVAVNTLAGLKAGSQTRVDLLHSFRATRTQIFRYVKLPAAAPYIFTGLDIGIVYSPVGAIVSEFLGANRGLGIALYQAEQNLDLAGVFALIILLGLMGIVLHLLLLAVRRRVVFWQLFTTASQT
jgi:NitT/TauT family transport system permease protein